MTAAVAGASGFITAKSSLGADLSLITEVAAAVLLTVGVALARRERYNAHRWVQTCAVVLNAVPVAVWMVVHLVRYILPGIPGTLSEHGHLVTTVHAAVGAFGVALGLFIVVRGNQLMARGRSLARYKTPMRVAYGLYLGGVALGIAVYVVVYG